MFAAALLLTGCSSQPPEYPAIRNALVIVLDDIGTDALRHWNGALDIPTPSITALAAQGVTFTRCYGSPRCDPARRQLVSGHWWTGSNGPICQTAGDSDTPTLDEDFLPERVPLHSVALYGKAHLGVSPSGADWRGALLEHGFDAVVDSIPGNLLHCGGTGYGNDLLRPGGQVNTSWLRVTAYGSTLIDSSEVAYQPDVIETAFLTGPLRWTAMPLKRIAFWCPQLAHDPDHPAEGSSPVLPPGLRFASMIAYLDAQIARVVAQVDLTKTMVVIVGDNGTKPGSAPDPTRAKGTTYEGGIRIPLVILGGPTVSGGRTSDELCSIVDVYQTALDWVGGVSAPSGAYPIVSHSLFPVLAVTSYTSREYVIAGDRWGTAGGDRCIVQEASGSFWKLRQQDTDGDGVVDTEALYALPNETTDHLATQAALATSLRASLSAAALP